MALIAEVWALLTLLFYMILSYFRVIYDLVVKPAKKNVEREIVLVTGAGHGIGREIALAFGRLGANTVLWDINKENNDATAKEIFEMGGESKSYVCDVSDPDSVRNVAERVREEVGDVTILVNNAGILHGGALLDLKDRDIQKTFGINTLSHFWTVREFLPAMLEKNRGHIVTMASMAAINGVAYLVDYSSSKWAVFGFTESLQDELRRLHRTGIKTTIVCPHFVSTGMTKFPKMTRLDDWLSPETTARIAVEGVLRNEEVVYIPRSMELPVLLQRFLTREGKRLLATALDIGIDPQYGTTTRSART